MIAPSSVRSKISKCGICGKDICLFNFDEHSPIYQIMLEKGCCYECAFWENMIANPPENMEVVNQTVYSFLPYQEPKFGVILGETIYILRKNGKLAMTNDAWNKGKVPWRFQDRLPDTAYMVSKKLYKQLSKGRMGCRARGCFDRYHCYRYNYRSEFDIGPYNKVPKDWIVGDERCPAFINLKDIRGFDYIDLNDILFNNLKTN